jgi:acetyl-CoA/propionyl-CoA carboxylase biotin carboxyl carrier protein
MLPKTPMPEPRILIANRGEIAVRVLRTCREMDIRTVAVYSGPDRDALHVELADDAYHLGPAAPAESYLNVPRILRAAKDSGATMIHPGYGFLAENHRFAGAVRDAGLTFIGPSPEAMAMVGDKAAARRAARRVGAPIVPGTVDPVAADAAAAEAERIGFPLLVKAAYGGGGKGMRLVESGVDLAEAVGRSARESKAYFGHPEVYLERYIGRAHHVEAQVLADRHGHYSFLGERDCTLQRRYQKLVEESPSPLVDEALRTRIGEAALAIAEGAGYENAGTVEFLLEEDGSFHFMEMNARLQVEHPVTEMVAGVDLVKLQILVALGEQVEVGPSPRGHAIECRLNAEDPYRDFLPGPGRVARYRPPGGPFVRIDAGIAEGHRVLGDYDSLFGKIIVWAEDRESARRRMLRALDELEIEGIPTTVPFHRWVLQTEEFRTGAIHTRWVEQALAEHPLTPPHTEPAVHPSPGAVVQPLRVTVEVDGHRIPVNLWGDDLRAPPLPPASAGGGHHLAGTGEVVLAPMQGTILQVLVEAGQEIAAGEVVCILEAMKMENHIQAHQEGIIKEVLVSKGDVVENDQPLAVIE